MSSLIPATPVFLSGTPGPCCHKYPLTLLRDLMELFLNNGQGLSHVEEEELRMKVQ